MRKILSLLLLLVFIHFAANAQTSGKTAIVKGRLVNANSLQPATDVQVTIPALKELTNSDADGNFEFSRVPYGTYQVIVGGLITKADTMSISVTTDVVDLKDLKVMPNDANVSPQSLQIPVIALEDNNLSTEDDGVKVANVSGLLSASRDPFVSTSAFIFGPYRFQPRGYNRGSQEVQINGNPMNDVETGDASWSQWGGLNDVFRSRSNSYGLQPSEYSYGDVNGSIYFDAAASGQRKQTRVSYSLSDRSYRNRLVFTQSSGLMKNGWAYSVSLSKRWANEGYIPGTFYDGYSYYAAVSKRFGKKHELNFITFGVPTRRGKSSPVTQETYDIANSSYYNPNWGYQNGVKRNARVADNFQPIGILSYEYKPSNSLKWTTTAGYQFGKNKNSSIDYYNGDNPRPDYYRNLPSYQILNGADPSTSKFYTQQQIDWDHLYNVNYNNRETINNVDGIPGNNVTGLRSVYVVADDVDDVKKFTFNTNIEKVLSEHITLTGGLQFISQHTESYKQLTDLMGGDFYLNLNQFAVQQNVPNVDFNQYDLNHPNRLIKAGDKYNYDYINRFTKGFVWGQSVFNYNKVDFFLAARLGYNDFSREGLYRDGLFPNTSFGKGDVQRFTTYSVKGGATYKLDGRNFLFVNAGYAQDAPTVDNSFISGRTRNDVVPGLTAEKTSSLEAGYLMRTPKYNLRAVGYVTDVKDAAEIKRYYNDDPAFKSFINYVMQGVNTRFIGTELAAEVKLNTAFTVTAVAAIGEAFYTNNPTSVGIYADNDTVSTPTSRQVYIKNYYLAAGPQSAYSLGLNYRSKKYWYASINCNYFDRNYVDISPDQRSKEAVELIQPGTALYNSIVDQQKLPAAFTVDLFGGKSFLLSKYSKRIPRGTFLYINAGISNLFDSQDIRTGGFEQLRYDFTDNNPNKFATKYFYGLGRNFFINLSLKF